MSTRPRVRMWLDLDGERRTIEVLESAVGLHSASGWQIDDSPPPPPAPRPARRRRGGRSTPVSPPATDGAGQPDPTTEEE